MPFDDKKNIIEVCLFESYLAKYFIENPEPFQSLISKILEAIEQVIYSNSDDRKFNRRLFMVFSILSEGYPNINDMDALKQSDSLVAFDIFCQYFTELVMPISSIKSTKMESQNSIQLSLASPLAQQSLFKSSQLGSKQILDTIRPAYLFLDKNRGVIEIVSEDEDKESKNLGILSSDDTPDSLKNFFIYSHFPTRQYYKPKEDSLMALWLRKHYLPVISGISGGIGKTVSKISLFVELSKMEYQLLGILVASSTIALGHHSFFEVIRPLSFFTGDLEEKSNLLEFYEQVFPEEIKNLQSYKSHIESYSGLIDEFIFDNPIVEDVTSSSPKVCLQ